MFRKILSLPFLLLTLLAATAIIIMVKTARLQRRLAEGANQHVYWVLLVAMRYVKGVPTWQPGDMVVNLFPRTKAQIAYAETQGITRVECTCGEPDCAAKNGVWVHKISLPPGFPFGKPPAAPGNDDVGSGS